MTVITRINEWLALRTTLVLGTMWATYAFIVLSVLPTLYPAQQNNILYVSNAIQLTFLPLLLVGQNIQGRKAEARAEADHAAIMEELELVKALHAEIHIALGIKETTCEVCASVGIG